VWRWKPAAGQTAGWTTKLVGDLDFGVWGQGCNGAEGKPGFAVVEVRRDAVSAPVAIGLQRGGSCT